MLLIIKLLAKFLQLINSETSPSQLAAGACFGLLVGLSPLFSLHNLVLFLLVCLLRVNFGMFFLSLAVFKILAFALDPFFDWLGYLVLVEVTSLRSFWVALSSMPVLPFFRFNNTIVAGSLTFGLAVFIPAFVFFVWAIHQYRRSWRERIKKSRAAKAIKATKLYGTFNSVYQKYARVRDSWERVT